MTPQQKLKQYKRNMKVFVQQVKSEVSALIQKYQTEIRKLKNQNQRLRNSQFSSQSHIHQYEFKQDQFENLSPIKKIGTGFSSPLADSTFCMTSKQFPKIKPIYNNSNTQFGFQNQMSRSRFQVDRLKRKQMQQQLIQSLQSGKNNLDLNTSKMLELFGKSKPKDQQLEFQQDEQIHPKSLTKSSGALNSSLASICQSLDKSFHAKKSRDKNAKKKKKQEKLRQQKLQLARKNEKMRKDEGIKNLLKTLRNNVNSNTSNPQVIKGNKLLSSGKQQKNAKLSKSKVMFNPVPVDITERDRKMNLNNTSINSSQPQSILKNSSRILTKSLIGNVTSISQQF